MSSAASWLPLIAPTLILIAGVIDDMRTRKVHNWLVLTLAIFSVANCTYFFGWSGLTLGLLSLGIALGCCLPLVLIKIMGAGDMKLLMAFAISVSPMAVFWVIIYAFIWGGLLGLFQALLQKEGLSLLRNTLALVSRSGSVKPENLHKVPYTVALFLGWLTQLSLTGFGGIFS